MLKSQVIIAGVALVAVIFLFNLPRHIVKNEKTAAGKAGEKPTVTQIKEEAHSIQLSESDRSRLESLRKNYLSVSDKEKKLKFADSLAVFFRNVNEFDSSAEYYDKIANLSPSPENLVKAGEAYNDAASFALDPGKTEDLALMARDRFQKALEKDPGNLETQTKLAQTYFHSGNEQTMTGVMMLREVLAKDPKNEEVLFTLGRLSIQSGQYDKAVERFQTILDINPGNTVAQFWLGYSQLELGNKKEAKASFKKVIKETDDPEIKNAAESYLKELK